MLMIILVTFSILSLISSPTIAESLKIYSIQRKREVPSCHNGIYSFFDKLIKHFCSYHVDDK